MLKLDPMISIVRLLVIVIPSPDLVRYPVREGIALMFMKRFQAIKFYFILTMKVLARKTGWTINYFA
ncbi:hypothetical protein [Methanosarcina mazei]|nr:hypothetical protein [Methanosarcina mazei]